MKRMWFPVRAFPTLTSALPIGTIVLCYELSPRVAGAVASVTESPGKELEGHFRAIGVDRIANYANWLRLTVT